MRRPVLAPGLRVLTHSREQVQIGLGAAYRLRLPDSEPVRRTLGHLVRGEAVPDDPETRAVLDDLAPVLVDSGSLVLPGVTPHDVAAAALHDPTGFVERMARRRSARVRIMGHLGPDPRPLLEAAGVPLVTDAATLVLALSVGEIDRSELDPLMRDGIPFQVVRLIEGVVVIGPLVIPGTTACLRCVDLHRSRDDPQHATTIAQHSGALRHDGVAEPIDTALTTLGLAWAVRDLVSHVEGERGTTWSTTVELSAGLATITEAHWLRHPGCGCVWSIDEGPSATMSP